MLAFIRIYTYFYITKQPYEQKKSTVGAVLRIGPE